MKYGIIFDCDGTLIDSLGQALESMNYALNKVGEESRTPEEIKRFFGTGADRIFFGLLQDENKAQQAFSVYLEHQIELANRTKLHTGVKELLDLLAEQKVPMGLVTGRHSKDLEIVLAPHHLADYFVTLITDDQLANSKPAPDGIILASQRMGILPTQTFYIGDSSFDIKAAHAAGSIPIAALWDSFANVHELSQENPKWMAKSPHDVWEFFNL